VFLLFFFCPNCGSSWLGHGHLGIQCGWNGVSKEIITPRSSMTGNRSPCRSFAHSTHLSGICALLAQFAWSMGSQNVIEYCSCLYCWPRFPSLYFLACLIHPF
jgi:hypothetical protein